jgi:acetyl-CoA carboxylase biotin carboxyl carrier protein
MTFKEIQELIKQLSKSNLSEFKLKDGEFELSIRTKHFHKGKSKSQLISSPAIIPAAPAMSAATSQPAVPAQGPAATQPAKAAGNDASGASSEESNNYLEIKSPMVGTFYRSPSPDKPVYVKVGDTVEKGSPVCIIEAMKLFNEIETEVSGKIVKVMVEDAQPVEYDQVLFLVDPS